MRTFLILELSLTIPAPRPDDLYVADQRTLPAAQLHTHLLVLLLRHRCRKALSVSEAQVGRSMLLLEGAEGDVVERPSAGKFAMQSSLEAATVGV